MDGYTDKWCMCVGELNEVKLWEQKAEIWQHKLKQVILPYLPPKMLEFLQNFVHFQHNPILLLSDLLAKTHKEGFALKNPMGTSLHVVWWGCFVGRRHHRPFCLQPWERYSLKLTVTGIL